MPKRNFYSVGSEIRINPDVRFLRSTQWFVDSMSKFAGQHGTVTRIHPEKHYMCQVTCDGSEYWWDAAALISEEPVLEPVAVDSWQEILLPRKEV